MNIDAKEIQSNPIQPPSAPGEWSVKQIEEALSRPLPRSLLNSKKLGGSTVWFLSWYEAVKILNKYAPGWNWRIISIHATGDRIFLVGELAVPTADGMVSRNATGTEELNCNSYGDPSSNAESMAFRRAAAKFGLGLYLYQK
jgi:hypothetical protein